MPAVLSAYEIGLHRKRQILMHPAVGPEDSLRIRVFTLERFDAVDLAHHPFSFTHLLEIHECGGPTLAAGFFLQAPSPKVMRAGNDAGLDSLCYPYLIDEVADFGMHLEQIAGAHFKVSGVSSAEPYWVAIGNFIEPFGVARSRMDQSRQAERRQQQHLVGIEIDVVRMDMALNVPGYRILGPLPVFQCLGEKFELA